MLSLHNRFVLKFRGRRAMRFFNTEGPVNGDKHYCLPPLQRWDLEEILSLIER